MSRYIDLSHAFSAATPVYPSYPPFALTILDRAATSTPQQRHLNSSQISLGLHCGTHLDAPAHFFDGLPTVEAVSLEACCGRCVAVPVTAEVIEPAHLQPFAAEIRTARRVLLRTGWESHWGQSDYFSAHPVLSGATAEWLIAQGVKLVGVDTPSVDRSPFPAHIPLLGSKVLILENLTNLAALPECPFELLACPLKIVQGEASPVRAVARCE